MTRVAINAMATGKIPAGDPSWPKFNDSFNNMDLSTLDLANEIYTGHSYAPWFNGRRKVENFVLGQHLAIDMDTGDARSSMATLARHPLVAGYGALIHTTPSHTEEKPRARAVFVLDRPIEDPSKYSAAARFLVSQFDGADSACVDAGRFFYGSVDCQIEIVGAQLPMDHLRGLFKRAGVPQGRHDVRRPEPYEQTPAPRNDVQTPTDGGHGGNRETTLDDVAAELERINAWAVSYEDWIRILMAIHGDFGDNGLSLAERWAKGAPGEVQRKFRSFKSTGNPTGIVTAGTIFEIGKRFK